MTEQVDCVVIGAGVVGLAIARQLAMNGHEVMILETGEAIGTGVSSRNSEVIHAGIYYPVGSLKAQLCLRGRELLYPYLESRGVEYRRCGKLVVASDASQFKTLEDIQRNAKACGVVDLELIDAHALNVLEPDLRGFAALLSPSSGIVDSHGLMLALLADAERHGALLALRAPVIAGSATAAGLALDIGDAARTRLEARVVVNAAGLFAQSVAMALGVAPSKVPDQMLAKGNYFSFSGRCPFSHLIYPVPEPGGLGVHLTLDLAGRAKFGPDVQWIEQLDYAVDESRRGDFAERIQAYWPALVAERLEPAYAGIRPKLKPPAGASSADFVIDGPSQHGVKGLISLYGIESPGLTSCLAIAAHVASVLGVAAPPF
jgi:L-2-hydroxyglutarate oxidase LhgO